MRFSTALAAMAATVASTVVATPFAEPRAAPSAKRDLSKRVDGPISPKVFIVSMFDPEAEVWWGIPEFDVLAQNISLPGLSPLFPEVHCTADGDICQFVIGESEINAATSVTALVLSDAFNLSSTYFFVAGIAGINPEVATTASVTFAKYAVQVALQYEFDARQIPANWTNGYVPFGAYAPDQYPTTIYGTEVFEVNEALQDYAYTIASTVTLNDSDIAKVYRAKYASSPLYAAGAAPPAVVKCDVATSDVYYSGNLLSEAFGNTTKLFTNGSGVYCSTAQEDNATLEVLVRAAFAGLVDFSRAIIMRTASDFDRQYPGEEPFYNLLYADQGAFVPAIQNIYIAGVAVVQGIVTDWDATFKAGIPAPNYIGDIFGTLGGTPDFGPGNFDIAPFEKRDGKPTSRLEMFRNMKKGSKRPART